MKRRGLAGSLYVAVIVVLAAVAAWPIYRSAAFVVLVLTAAALAAAIAALVARRGWGGWTAAGLLAAALLITGVPLAVPSRVTDPASFLRGLGDLASGLVVGWKDLLTVDLPVGSYRNLLVPALVVFLVGTATALLLAWRADTLAVAAVPVGLAMTGFGLLFGRTEVSAPLTLGPITLYAPAETLVGLGSLAAGVLWLSWRSREARLLALRRAAVTSGVRMRRAGGADARRTTLGLAMVGVAAVAALTVPPAAASAERDVLRESTGPRVEISKAVSPLAAYRSWFTDDEAGRILFRVTGDAPQRLRIAVLNDYDGSVYRTGAEAPGFVRVASARNPDAGERRDFGVVLGALEGIWMPTAGSLASVGFEGPRAAALTDGFYVDDDLSAAVQTAGWASGDAYRVDAAVATTPPLAEAMAPGGGTDGGPEAPASLRTWVQNHASGTDGAALEALVALLRERGYLSHSLTDAQVAWMPAAGVDTFVPSAAGHSLARIDQLFTALLEREQDPRAAASGNFVAAIGDDEQFAVAVSLIAHSLGFPSRVVVGVRTSASDPQLTTCAAEGCRTSDVSAWVEVRSAAGDWIPVDVTPQHTVAPSREVTAQPDPTIGTEVRPDTVDEVEPPKPAQEDAPTSIDRPDPLDLAWLWAGLRVAGSILGAALVLIGPFLLVVGVKALRRRTRRSAGDPAERIAGGWDEYIDAAADAGRRPPSSATRAEIAAAIESPGAAGLAGGADRAVFSGLPTTDDDATEFWRLVDRERAGFAETRWQRLRTAVSLRSFVPGDLRPSPFRTERGSRAQADARRTE